MQIKNIILSVLFAGATLAAPVTSADTTVEKRAGKCDAHIYVDGSTPSHRATFDEHK